MSQQTLENPSDRISERTHTQLRIAARSGQLTWFTVEVMRADLQPGGPPAQRLGVDPHKRSATIEIINERKQTVGHGQFFTNRDGYKAMLAAGRKHHDRLWAVEAATASVGTSGRRGCRDQIAARTSCRSRSQSSEQPPPAMAAIC